MESMVEICGKECLLEGILIRVLRIDAEGYDYFDDPFEALREIRAGRTKADLFTFVQKPSETDAKYNLYWEADNFACLTITSYDHWISQQIDSRVPTKIRKSAKAGVTVREVEFDEVLVKGISEIYNESPVRQGKPFWHYRKEIDEVRRMNATFLDRSIFIGAYLDGALIGFIKMVTSEDRTLAGPMQIVSMISQRDKAPNNALMAQAVKSCAERGIKHLLYGNFSFGKKLQDSLADFKRHNGFQKVEVPRYYVPLTLPGQVALRLGLHHRFKERIPEPIARTFRAFRTRWYASKYAVAGSSRKSAANGSLQ